MKKIILLFLIALLASCGINTETTVEYDIDSDKVVLTSNIEVDETYYEYIDGGRKAVTNALKDNLWDGAKLTEEVDGYTITTSFKDLDAYNEFMKKRTSSEGIAEDTSIDVLTVNSEYTFSEKEDEYLNDYIDDVYDSLEFTEEIEFDVDSSEHIISRYVNELFVKDGQYKNSERYKTESDSLDLNLDLKVVDDEIELSIENLDLQFEVYIESEHDRAAITENFDDLDFKVKEDENKLLISASYKSIDDFPSDVYVAFPEVECALDDSNFFTNKYSCDISDSYNDGLTGNLNIDGGRVASSIPVEIFVNGKNISKDLGEEITELKIANVVILAISILFVLVVFIVIYKLLKNIYKDKGIVKGLGQSKVVKGVQNVTKESYGVLKEEISSSSFSTSEAPVEKKRVLECINDFVEIKLITILFILFSTPLGIAESYAADMGGSLEGQMFFHDYDKKFKEVYDGIYFGFGTVFRVFMIVLTFMMIIKYILIVVRVLKLSPLLNKLIDTVYYFLLLVLFIVYAFYVLAHRNEGVSLNYVYYALIFISLYSIVKSLVGFGKNFKMSMFSKYFIIMILMNFLNVYGFIFSIENFDDSVFAFSYSHAVFSFYSLPFMVFFIICILVVLTFLILDLCKVFGVVASSVLVYINVVFYPLLIVIYYFGFGIAASIITTEGGYDEFKITSFVLGVPGIIYLIIAILMVVYAIIETNHVSKLARQKRIEKEIGIQGQQQVYF